MTAGQIAVLIVAVCATILILILRRQWRSELWAGRCALRDMEMSRDHLYMLVVERNAELFEARKKCDECFLDQTGLRRKITDLEANEVELAQRLGHSDGNYDRAMKELSAEKRSNAALRGQLTKLKKGKP